MIRVAVVDDQALVRAGFEMLLESAPDLDVVGSAADGAEAVDLVVRTQPDVVLMDIRMPVMDGLEATRRILADERCADVRILILTTFDLDEYVYAALQAGASGFLLKDTPPADLLAGVRLVAGRRSPAVPGHHPAPDRSVRSSGRPTARSPTPPASTSSPTGSATSSPWSPRDCPTPRSAPGSTSAPPPSRPTSPAS